ncbi:MAG: dihydrolipoyl dehydrogenase [Alphaproteobacteria bacterium]|nr:dihydrolipoyl dehydrogenase [Alphaproteobacteria bacterium]MBF0130162.1 dihydrolipoyl dehydrogenase [Alphaproteobacteria bacterium]
MAYDLIVVGGGPGGYVCAIRAAQLGMKVACVEKRDTLGGTCLNVGCIPSKALLQSSHLFEMAGHGFSAHGIKVDGLAADLDVMMGRKAKVVDELTKGIAFLFRKNKVDHVHGTARVVSAHEVVVGDRRLQTKAVVIATGSESAPLPGVDVDEERIVTSTGALSLTSVPRKMVVIGAGVIGLELGSVWRRLGAEVTVVEFLDFILPPMDGEVRKIMLRLLQRQGMAFRLGHSVTAAVREGEGVKVTVEPVQGGGAETLAADIVLLAIGRRPHAEGLDALKLDRDPRGFIVVDRRFCTNIPGIHAIGDVIGGAMLAHKAEDEGVAVAEILAGGAGHVNYDVIPSVVYTWPEVGAVGRTEEQLKEAGIAFTVGKFPFSANARAKCNADADGFAKILADARTDRILGAHIVGPQAGDLIAEVSVAMEFGASAEDIARSCHAHPSLAEAVREAALAVAGRAVHA